MNWLYTFGKDLGWMYPFKKDLDIKEKYPEWRSKEKESVKMIEPEELVKIFSELEPFNVRRKLCDVSTLFKNIRTLSEDEKGCSDCSPFFAEFNDTELARLFVNRGDRKVFVKICTESETSTTYLHEALAYFFVSKLTEKRCPNFMRIIAYFECEEHDKALSNYICKKVKNPGPVRILVIERGQGLSFDKWLTKNRSTHELIEIVFQVGYALREMNLHGLRHNDMHDANIWIASNETEPVVYHAAYGKYYKMVPRVKIFDFDSSSFTGAITQNYSKAVFNCKRIGTCSNTSLKNDFVKFFYWLKIGIDESGAKHLEIFYRKLFELLVLSPKWDPSSENSWYTKIGNPCNRTEEGTCDPNYVIPDEEFRSFTSLVVDTNFFDHLLFEGNLENEIIYESVGV